MQKKASFLARRVRSPVALQVAHQNLLQVISEGTFLSDLRLYLGHILLELANRDEQLAKRRGHVIALQTRVHRVPCVTLIGRAVRLNDAQNERVLLVRRLRLRALARAERQTVINRAGAGDATGTGTNTSTTTAANNACSTPAG